MTHEYHEAKVSLQLLDVDFLSFMILITQNLLCIQVRLLNYVCTYLPGEEESKDVNLRLWDLYCWSYQLLKWCYVYWGECPALRTRKGTVHCRWYCMCWLCTPYNCLLRWNGGLCLDLWYMEVEVNVTSPSPRRGEGCAISLVGRGEVSVVPPLLNVLVGREEGSLMLPTYCTFMVCCIVSGIV